MVENLFEKLPVRRKDFVKSIRKHFQKMVRVVQSYALISVGVKIIVTNTTTSLTATSGVGGTPVGSRQTVFATQSGGKLTDNVSILFGAKFASSLLPIEFSVQLGKTAQSHTPSTDSVDLLDAAMDSTSEPNETSIELGENSAEKEKQNTSMNGTEENVLALPSHQECNSPTVAAEPAHRVCKVRGLVSKVGLGVGRSDNDRQFTFCNGRPVDLPRFAKTLNEVWRKYEMKQKPAFVLDISVPAGYFDVNLTPDKREVLIVQEAAILAQLREVVDALYLPVRQTMPLNQGMAGGLANPTWASMFASQSQTSLGEEFTEPAPIVRNLVQSALVDYLVTPTDSHAKPPSPTKVVSTESISGNDSTSSTQISSDGLITDPVRSRLSHKREAVVWMSPLERDRFPHSPTRTVSSSVVGDLTREDEGEVSPTTKRARTNATDPSPSSSSPSTSRATADLTPSQLNFASQTSTTSGSSSSGAQMTSTILVGACPADGEEVEFLAKSNVWNFDPDAALSKFSQLRDRKRSLLRAKLDANPIASAAAPPSVHHRDVSGAEADAFDITKSTIAQSIESHIKNNSEGASGGEGISNASKVADRLQARVLHKKVRFDNCCLTNSYFI